MVALMTLTALGSSASPASGRTHAQATRDARDYFSAVDCPHHRAGICKDRDGRVLAGIGNGRWTAMTRGWECWWWEPCGLDGSIKRNGVRWYYTRTFIIENDGTRSHVSAFGEDG